MIDFSIFVIAMVVLIYGAEIAIKEAEKIALRYNISHFVIGATLIAVGTSLPEMAASMSASYKHHPDIAVANVIGSNIFNISLVLGVIFFFAKGINPSRNLFAIDSAWIVLPLGVFVLVSYDGIIDIIDGFIFLSMMGGYLLFLSKDAKQLEAEIDDDIEKEKFKWSKSGLFLVLGFGMIIGGADFAIDSAGNIARSFGISEWVVGLILMAFGTSLPELVVSIKAISKGNADMSIGNIIGSNLANFSMVLGGSAIINPLSVDYSKNGFDIAAMIIVSFMLIFITANKLYSRPAGIALLGTFVLVIKNSF